MTNHVEARVVLHRGLLSIAKPAMRHRIPAASFQPQEEESKKETYDAEDARYE